MTLRCPHCGWFLSHCSCYKNVNGDVVETHGTCKRCGDVSPTDWEYEDWGDSQISDDIKDLNVDYTKEGDD